MYVKFRGTFISIQAMTTWICNQTTCKSCQMYLELRISIQISLYIDYSGPNK